MVFLKVFTQIERTLEEVTSVEEIARLADLVKGLLENHADTEDNLLYLALDHALEDQGKLHGMYQEHREMDESISKIKSTVELEEARRLLQKAIHRSRVHFKAEENHVFPVIERVLQRETLKEMGRTWQQKSKAG